MTPAEANACLGCGSPVWDHTPGTRRCLFDTGTFVPKHPQFYTPEEADEAFAKLRECEKHLAEERKRLEGLLEQVKTRQGENWADFRKVQDRCTHVNIEGMSLIVSGFMMARCPRCGWDDY